MRPAVSSERAHKLTTRGNTRSGNSFVSYDLARRMRLPMRGRTMRFFCDWDPDEGVLRFTGHRPEFRE